MRKLSVAMAVVAVTAWAASAHAGSVSQKYNVSQAYGASGATTVYVFGTPVTVPANSVTGMLSGAVSTPNSTFTGSVPPSSANVHLSGGTVTATGTKAGFNWKVQGTVWAAPVGSTSCHVGAGGKVAASCSASFDVTTKAHCSGGRCFAPAVPGCFASPYTSVTHSQMWLAKSVHLGAATFSHTANSAHYLKSFNAKLVPPVGHLCGSGSGAHIASSDSGFHTFHVGAKQTQ